MTNPIRPAPRIAFGGVQWWELRHNDLNKGSLSYLSEASARQAAKDLRTAGNVERLILVHPDGRKEEIR